MSTFELWLTPSITLSLILESESPAPSLTRWISSWVLYFRPALLRQALAYELEQRPEQDVVSAGTLRIVDYAYWRTTAGEVSLEDLSAQATLFKRIAQTPHILCGFCAGRLSSRCRTR
jgi:hypothetical protein